jgi:hypothetical protein
MSFEVVRLDMYMRSWLTIRLAAFLALGIAVLSLCASSVYSAQGCAMCYQNASASGAQGSQALRHGILILLFPTLALFTGIFGLIYHRRNVSR